MNHMQDLFIKIPYSSQFFMKVQKRDFSKKVSIIIRESPEYKERLVYRKFFKGIHTLPVSEHKELINDFITDQLKVARRYSHLAYKEQKLMS